MADGVDAYILVKTVHIISSTLLFGTGLGTAFFFWRAHAAANASGRLVAARTTVLADFAFTLPAVIVQPLTGAWLIVHSGIDPRQPWLVATYGLYLIAGACWLPVVALQLRMKRMLEQAEIGVALDERLYARLYRWWFALGWPAFASLVLIFLLMVGKPNW